MEGDKILIINYNCYMVFLLWDIYCNYYQLMILVYLECQMDMIYIMMGIYKEYGWFLKWELYGCEILMMEGDFFIFVLVDSWMKGL